MKATWYRGIPPIAVVAEHETTRKGFSTGELSISRGTGESTLAYVPGNSMRFGTWIVNHVRCSIQPYTSISRLKVIEGEVYLQLGFTQWLRMSDCNWKNDVECFPVSDTGLPLDYKETR